ncbi:hypothetical protein CPAR01_14901 [Colletotrichum paranaense]|uniref:Protein kinase domain-containing protein n=1 Tax=Colletotrichum paranaense TaxID=1914294 RepID=A0ABQ9S088_9PEZI|nr:uncharacterized protein CPAR01_14901 [Colletotrichum paranaense]KAK1521378.1 hypothetical protein CPAR01_14901 [Colletotrichum paranaense]
MNELAIRNAAARRYAHGEKLDLVPHHPWEPFGSGKFPPFQDDYQPRSLQPTAEELKPKKPQLKIVEPLRAGRDVGSQILLCKVVQAPTDRSDVKKHAPFPSFPRQSKVRRSDNLVVAKVFDPRLYPMRGGLDLANEPPFDDATVAYSRLCREAAVYQFLYEKGKSGHPHMTAQYYGCWVTNRKALNSDSSPDAWVGLILIEYIEGLSIEAMCTRDRNTGYLQPPLGRDVSLHSDHKAEGRGQAKMLPLDRQVCLDAIKSLLGQIVVCMHLGVSVPDIFPRNVFLTLRNNGLDLPTPRVVMLDHLFSYVWEHTEAGKAGVPAYFAHMKLPPHPWEQFGIRGKMRQFLGWIPEEWDDGKAWSETTTTQGAAATTAKSFDDWLVDCFGPLQDSNPDYTVYPEEVSDIFHLLTFSLQIDQEQAYAEMLRRRREREDVRARDASIPQRPGPRQARTTQDISPGSPTRKAAAEEGEGGEQESSTTSTSFMSQVANSPSHQYLGGLIVREATGSGSGSDDEQQQQPPQS